MAVQSILSCTAALLLLAAPVCVTANGNQDLVSLTESHTRFAFSLYPTMGGPSDNLVFSPHSISQCLSMLYMGSRGETQTQMQKTLHLDLKPKNIAKASYAMAQSLLPAKGEDKSYRLNNANALWVDQRTFLMADFRYAIEEQFKAKLGKINFAIPQDALSLINSWVSTQTEGKIPNLLTSNEITKETRLVLTNAVYFQGNWVNPFDVKATQDWPFHPTPETSMSVRMMDKILTLPYYENDLLQAAALPFVGTTAAKGHLALVVLLPKSAENFSAMCQALPSGFGDWLFQLQPHLLSLKLPKVTINNRSNLNEALKALGMEDAFTPDANFSGIDGLRDLQVNQVVHQAFFALDENGVIAAAATAATMNLTYAPPDPASAVPMIVDHPFLFFIVDLPSQEILFMGQVTQPAQPGST